ncbi:SGNH/GDSL hydrolase family protein [Mycoplasma sp. 'Moose RK']|uniref:SGNH/GDSL hydrolase family protein n=1 Tax=Mycoplasma sp. 'Moose RK' TaxID=2780095 RepID=UPI0018C1F611|nr:SGNH/GDSL hydrolase family protein [Mycoplasma sp. 'Moose RK']MBG0730575.1 SGNH/GDSL hydrolase family protein [Mycoplasma sp. 'Moose RK']
MKTNTNYIFWKKFLKLTVSAIPLATFATLVSCVVRTSDAEKLKEVKYLAIGDSVTAGFNQETYTDYQGKFTDNKPSGLSYPAFFAHFLQKINPSSLVSYENLAFSGATVKNWLYLLKPDKYPDGKISDNPFVSKETQNSANFNNLSTVFNKFEKPSFPTLIQKVSDANLLTMTVGANDIFLEATKFGPLLTPESSGILEELMKIQPPAKNETGSGATTTPSAPSGGNNSTSGSGSTARTSTNSTTGSSATTQVSSSKITPSLFQTTPAKTPKLSKEEIKVRSGIYIANEIDNRLKELKTDVENLINELKAINPNLKINLLSYKLPNSTLVKVLKHLLNNEFGLGLDFVDKTVEKINKIHHDIATNKGINFVDPYDQTVWNDNDQIYGATDFDIHPKIKGYKKIAEELILKLGLDQSQSDQNVANLTKVDKKFIDVNKDGKLAYRQMLDFSAIAPKNEDLIKKLRGDNDSVTFIKSNSEFEDAQTKTIESGKNTLNQSLLSILDSNFLGKLNFKELIKSTGGWGSTVAGVIPDGSENFTITKGLKSVEEIAVGNDLLKATVDKTKFLDSTLNELFDWFKKHVNDTTLHKKITFKLITKELINLAMAKVDLGKALTYFLGGGSSGGSSSSGSSGGSSSGK